MKQLLPILAALCALAPHIHAAAAPADGPAPAAPGKLLVTVTNELDIARPAETISIPFAEVRQLLAPQNAGGYWGNSRQPPAVRWDNLVVRDAQGNIIPSQVTNTDTKGGRNYEYYNVLFQHDFAAGEKTATFTIEAIEGTAAPFPSKVFARYVPDRLDDFAWENDRVAHRIYGPGLELPSAGPDQMPVGGSGIDFWGKRVPYLIINRWYAKGHNPLHADTGEGVDMYQVGQSRGLGGTGVWDGQAMRVSRNWRTWKVLANGPIRAEFELTYEAWDAGNGATVSEVKRFTLDAGVNFTQVVSTFAITGADELTIGVGVTQHNGQQDNAQLTATLNDKEHWEAFWEVYPRDGQLGTAIVFAPGADFAGFAHSTANIPRSTNLRAGDGLILSKVKNGAPLSYWIGAGWDRSGQFATQEEWLSYVGAWAQRIRSPLKVTVTKQ